MNKLGTTYKRALLAGWVLVSAAVVQAQMPRPGEYEKRDRRHTIQPQRPTKGIKSGLVIAYGHPMRPPYLVESRGEKIFVNSVQVLPSTVDEKYWATRSQPTAPESETAVSESLWRSGNEIQEMARKGEPLEKIFDFAKQQPYMSNVRWESPGVLEYTRPSGQRFSIELPRAGEKRIDQAEIKKRSTSAIKDRAKQIETLLKKGRCVIFVDGGISEQILRASFPSGVPKIMDDAALSTDEKTKQLRDLLGVESVAADVMANYVREEWAIKR